MHYMKSFILKSYSPPEFLVSTSLLQILDLLLFEYNHLYQTQRNSEKKTSFWAYIQKLYYSLLVKYFKKIHLKICEEHLVS